jgi:hypothetical protein
MNQPSAQVKEFDSPTWRVERNERMLGWMNGNVYAREIALILADACEMWDDLIDQDKPVSPADADRVMVGVFVKLATNPLWQQSRVLLEPIIIVAINAWMDANELANREEEKLKQLAFHIRNYATEVTIMCAFIAGGWDHVRKVSAEMREFFQHESFNEWELRK